MQKKVLEVIKTLPFFGLAYMPIAQAVTDDMGGTWSSLTLSGSLQALSANLADFRWLVMDQARTRDDNPDGMRLSENLAFAQLGYALNQHASIWLGYVHDWGHPLGKTSYQESRPYQDFLWNSTVDVWRFTSRTRLEERVRQDTGDLGIRLRQLLQVSYPLAWLDDKLSVYVGDETLWYLNGNDFGRNGFSENRALGGVSYQFSQALGADLGYLGQYVYSLPGLDNVFTHNVQFNLRYQF